MTSNSSTATSFSLDLFRSPSTRKGHAVGFEPGDGVQWTASTSSEAMKQLVDSREQVFAAHRKFNKRESKILSICTLLSPSNLSSLRSANRSAESRSAQCQQFRNFEETRTIIRSIQRVLCNYRNPYASAVSFDDLSLPCRQEQLPQRLLHSG